MRLIRLVVLGIVLSLILSCKSPATYVQFIEFDICSSREENVQLVKELAHYDVAYLTSRLQEFDRSDARGMRFGYFIRERDGAAIFRVRYNLRHADLNLKCSRSEKAVEVFIRQMAQTHLLQRSHFDEWSLYGEEWINVLLGQSASSPYAMASKELQNSMTEEELERAKSTIENEFGGVQRTSLIRGQYYENYQNSARLVNFDYLVEFSSNRSVIFKVLMNQENGDWKVFAFQVRHEAE